MRRPVIVAALAAFIAACGDSSNPNPNTPSNTGPLVFTAQLSAANEVPPVANAEANARGNVTITINVPRDSAGVPNGNGTANFAVQMSGFPPGTPAIAAHIHPGAAGATGGALVNTGLSPATAVLMGDGTATVTFSDRAITQEQATNIMNNPGGFYFNVHTQLNPGGAIRGQLVRQQ